MGVEGYVLKKINLDAWIKLVCSVYLAKHKTLFNSEPIGSLYTSLMATPLADEVIKYVLNDGGFKVFASKCGHKGDICQWQDIHNVLVATYEALLQSAVEEY